VLLPRSPLSRSRAKLTSGSYDLHALSTLRAFTLSQDQTLRRLMHPQEVDLPGCKVRPQDFRRTSPDASYHNSVVKVPPHRFGDPCPSGNLAGHQGLQRILFYSTGAGVCQGPSLRALPGVCPHQGRWPSGLLQAYVITEDGHAVKNPPHGWNGRPTRPPLSSDKRTSRDRSAMHRPPSLVQGRSESPTRGTEAPAHRSFPSAQQGDRPPAP
jgi:hypothetical protein